MIYHCGDCLDILPVYPDGHFDLVFTSPPYENVRTYGIGFDLSGDDWVDWSVARFVETLRVCKGLVAWVVEGKTRQFQYSATPIHLMSALARRGVKLRKPPIYHRVGIPGSGGPDWLRNDYEFIVCASHGRLPWSDNTAMGHPPKHAPGGKLSYRDKNGKRRHTIHGTSGYKDGDAVYHKTLDRAVTEIANPGNVIKCNAGGGLMGSKLCHENEAPFPEALAEFFVRSFCPPAGRVLDPFCGSGTTLAVAKKFGRNYTGIDIRESQIELTQRRLAEVLGPDQPTPAT